MTPLYVAVNVNAGEDARIDELSVLADYAYFTCLRVPKRLLTDGTLTLRQARRELHKLDDATFKSVVKELTKCGLWVADGDHYTIPGFLKMNKSVAQIKKLTKTRIAAGKRGGKESAKSRSETPEEASEFMRSNLGRIGKIS